MRDLRMKIAGIAVALGLGGFAGYAISSKNAPPAATGTLAGTKVVRRTVHAKRPKHKAKLAHARARAAQSHSESLASQPVSTGSSGATSSSSSGSPVHTGSSGSSGSGSASHHPVNTGSSGASGGSGGRGPVSTGSSGGGGAAGGEAEKGDRGEREGGD